MSHAIISGRVLLKMTPAFTWQLSWGVRPGGSVSGHRPALAPRRVCFRVEQEGGVGARGIWGERRGPHHPQNFGCI